jgi:predicted HicB family RNase H-like nuclease
VTRLNYDYPEGEHQQWKLAATHAGIDLKAWVRRALNQVAKAEKAERDKRRR